MNQTFCLFGKSGYNIANCILYNIQYWKVREKIQKIVMYNNGKFQMFSDFRYLF